MLAALLVNFSTVAGIVVAVMVVVRGTYFKTNFA